MYLPPPGDRVWRLLSEFIPASPTKTQRPSFHHFRSALTFSTVVTSVVLPVNTHDRTGRPSRVTAMPMTICGASVRPFFECPRLRSGS